MRISPSGSGVFLVDEPCDTGGPGGASDLAKPSRTPRSRAAIDDFLLPAFQQSWWLDVARTARGYHEIRVLKAHRLVGVLPYRIRRTKLGLGWGAAPDWSHLGGPVVCQSLSEAEKAEVLQQLIAKLPAYNSYGFLCRPYTADAALIRRAFTDAGFTHFVEKTYTQAPDQADVLSRLSRKHRAHIEAARKALEVCEIAEEEFIAFYSKNLAEAELASRLPLGLAGALIAKGRRLDPPRIKVFAARKSSAGAPLDAAIACVWDNFRYYYWMSTRRRRSAGDPHDDAPHPDAIKLLIVNAMAHAQSLGLVFDTDGCSTPGTQRLYSELLRIPTPETRDVFERLTGLHRWWIRRQDRLETYPAIQSLKRKLKLAATPWLPGRGAPSDR